MADTKNSLDNLVSLFYSLGDETLKQNELMRNTAGNNSGTLPETIVEQYRSKH